MPQPPPATGRSPLRSFGLRDSRRKRSQLPPLLQKACVGARHARDGRGHGPLLRKLL
ncbi:MAG: hypothetical protein OJF55_000537 [Rhodanobacteraceae bacterium]|nr:MAG: hypothetical protein OJF55_000537 [Rhodanobacteraceae bacterium]